MSRTVKLVVLAAVLEMILLALAVAAWRWQAAGGTLTALPPTAVSGKAVFGTLMLFFFPAWMGMGSWLAARKMARPGLKAAPDTRRHNEITLIATAAFAMGVQAWTVGSILGIIPKDGMQIRAIEALTGVFVMVVGNFTAKTSPPTGERAPDPAVWTRCMLRIGWISVAAGLTILIAAIAAPIDQMIWVIVAAVGFAAIASTLQRRGLRRKPA